MNGIPKKKCSVCGQEKFIGEFPPKGPGKSRDSHCYACRSKVLKKRGKKKPRKKPFCTNDALFAGK